MLDSTRNIEPMKEPSLTRIDAQAPPDETSSMRKRVPHQLPHIHLATNYISGDVHQTEIPEESDEDDLLVPPPLISYCSYVRFGFVFARWHILVAVVNLGAYSLCRKEGYFSYHERIPFDSWMGSMMAGIWFATSVWAYLSARRYERDVQKYDQVAQYELGQQTEDPESPFATPFATNYDHMNGWVSREIDAAFTRTKSGGRTHLGNFVSRRQPEGTSSLVNLSFVLWSISLSAAFFLAFGIILGEGSQIPSNSTTIPSNSTTPVYKNDYNKLQTYPSGVQDWANIRADHHEYQGHGEDRMFHDFPNSLSTGPGSYIELKDGTTFFAGFPPPVKQEGGKVSNQSHMVLIESPGSGGCLIYHEEFWDPCMFIPVESTMANNSRGESVASQFCFATSEQKKKRPQYWEVTIRTTPIVCIISVNATAYGIHKQVLTWTDKSLLLPVRAASTGTEVLIARTGFDGFDWYQEVLSVLPPTMTKQGVLHMTTGSIEEQRKNGYVHVRSWKLQIISGIATVAVLVLCSAWLILREGVPAGAAPFCFAVVLLIRICTRWNRRERFDYSGIRTMSLVFGTIFFHCALSCGGACRLPSWVGRELKVWGLYSWVLAFYASESGRDVDFLALILLGTSGIILNQPTCKLMGYAMVAHSAFITVQLLILRIFFFQEYQNEYRRSFRSAFVGVLLGMGVVGLENLVSSNRRYCVAFWRPMAQAGRTLFYGSHHNNAGGRRSLSS